MKTKHAGTTAIKPAPWNTEALKAYLDEAVGLGTVGFVTRGGKKKTESLREAACGRLIEAAPGDGAESASSGPGRIFKVLLITEGLSANGGNYYGPEAIASCPQAFNGKKAYIDHPTKSGQEDQPERSVRAVCGYYRNVEAIQASNGAHVAPADLVTDDTEAGRYAAECMEAALAHERDFPGTPTPHLGLSINADGAGEERMMQLAEGQKAVNYVLQILDKPDNSVDIVTTPARGGRVLECLESLRRKEDVNMKKLIESLAASMKAAKESKDPKVLASHLAEAEKITAKLIEADGAEGVEAMCAKHDGETDEAHQGRMQALHGHLSQLLGKEGSALGDPEPAAAAAPGAAASPDTVHATGKAAHALLKGKEAAEAVEAKRLAVKQLIAESKIPEKYVKALNVENLAKAGLVEARAQIASMKALVEAMHADAEEGVGAAVEKLTEARGGKGGAINLGECVRS